LQWKKKKERERRKDNEGCVKLQRTPDKAEEERGHAREVGEVAVHLSEGITSPSCL
jgi:hypothetical protein